MASLPSPAIRGRSFSRSDATLSRVEKHPASPQFARFSISPTTTLSLSIESFLNSRHKHPHPPSIRFIVRRQRTAQEHSFIVECHVNEQRDAARTHCGRHQGCKRDCSREKGHHVAKIKRMPHVPVRTRIANHCRHFTAQSGPEMAI